MLKGKTKFGILSNSDSRTHKVLKYHDLDRFFEFTILSGEMTVEKPNPEIFKQTLSLLKIQPPELLHIGNSYENDYVAAKQAGCHAVLIQRDQQSTMSIPKDTKTITSFNQLEEYL